MSARTPAFTVVAALLAAVISATGASAASRVCKTDHFHYGSSTDQPNKKTARAVALRAWADFTVFEYGSAWGSYRRARSKAIRCNEIANRWSCNVEAVPCRPARRKRR